MKKHHIVEIRGDVTMRDGRTDEQLKIELLSQWNLEAEFRNDGNLNLNQIKWLKSVQQNLTVE